MRGLTHPQRRVLLNAALSMVAAGNPVSVVAEMYGYTTGHLYTQSRKVGIDITSPDRTRNAPVATEFRAHIWRRDAQITELSTLGLTRHQVADKLHCSVSSIYQTVKRLGLQFVHAAAEAEGHAKLRCAPMAALYRDGYTLEEISRQYGITRERVRQLISKHYRLTGENGGHHIKAERAKARRAAAHNAKCLSKYGCDADQFATLKRLRKPLYAFQAQRRNARVRGIEWQFNLWEWWAVWQASGHWEKRGRGQGYVMCRNDDIGPYAAWNVYIATSAQNVSDGMRKKRKDPSLPMGVSRTDSGRYAAGRTLNSKFRSLGTYDTPELAYAAYLMAAPIQSVAA